MRNLSPLQRVQMIHREELEGLDHNKAITQTMPQSQYGEYDRYLGLFMALTNPIGLLVSDIAKRAEIELQKFFLVRTVAELRPEDGRPESGYEFAAGPSHARLSDMAFGAGDLTTDESIPDHDQKASLNLRSIEARLPGLWSELLATEQEFRIMLEALGIDDTPPPEVNEIIDQVRAVLMAVMRATNMLFEADIRFPDVPYEKDAENVREVIDLTLTH